jgi:hypothetical protein
MLIWPPKDADEVLIYPIDWSGRLGDDTIISASFSVSSGDVVIASAEHDEDTISQATISGGTSGTKAKVLCQIVTGDGQTLQQTATLVVRAR